MSREKLLKTVKTENILKIIETKAQYCIRNNPLKTNQTVGKINHYMDNT